MMELPLYANIDEVRQAALECRACGRAETRNQVVFGAGNPKSALMLIGEAPSTTDDSTGLPFTGPAGGLLDELLEEVGTSRDEIWITNLLRCFKGRQRDGRIENQPARQREIQACKRWLDLEIQYVNPRVILAVGAPAARVLIEPDFKLIEGRGQPTQRADGRTVIATIQPAYVMRLRSLVDQETHDLARTQLILDLSKAVELAGP